jgi:haloalkane dehalogenase
MQDNANRPTWVDSELYPFHDQWIMIDGHRIHYVDEGPRDAPLLLFIHPGPGWSFTYRYQIKELSGQFRCIAPDLPGYGLSEAGEGYDYSLGTQSYVLDKFVETLNLRNMIVWANDGGGPTAILGLARESDRVLGLVVGGTFGWSIKQYRSVAWTLRIVTSPIFRFINRYSNFLARSMGSKMALGTRILSKREREHYTRPFNKRDSRNRALRLFASFNDKATQEELDQALQSFRDKPVLIQFGDEDPMTAQKWPQRWAEELPNNRLILIPHVKHFTFEGAPQETVDNFLSWWVEAFAMPSIKAPLKLRYRTTNPVVLLLLV